MRSKISLLTASVLGAAALSGCTTYNRNLDYISVDNHQANAIYALASANTNSANRASIIPNDSNAIQIGKSYSGIAQADLTFNVVSSTNVETFRINTSVPGWANQYALQMNYLESLIPDNSSDSVQVINKSDASTRKGRRDQLSSRDGLSAIVNFSRVQNDNEFALDVKQKRLAAKDTYSINVDFNPDSFHAKKTKTGLGETVFGAIETAGAGALAGWPGAAIAGGINVVEGFHAHYSTKNHLPSNSNFSKDVTYLGLSKDQARIYNLFALAAETGSKQVILVPNSEGLGAVLANNPTKVYSPQDGIVSFTSEVSEGNLRLLAYSALRILPYVVGQIDNCNHHSGVTGGDGSNPGGGHVTGGDGSGVGGVPR